MDLSITEMLVLAVLGLLIFGPNKLPQIARNVGKAIRSFQAETSRAMGELRSAAELEELQRTATDAGAMLRTDEASPSKPASPAPAPSRESPTGATPLIFEDT